MQKYLKKSHVCVLLCVFQRPVTHGTGHEGGEGAASLSHFYDIWNLKTPFLELGRNIGGFYLKKNCFNLFSLICNFS